MRTQATVFVGTLARIILKTLDATGSRSAFGVAASTLLLGLTVGNAQMPAPAPNAVVRPVRKQVIVPPLDRIHDPAVWRVVNRRATLHEEEGRKFVRLDSGAGISNAWLSGFDFKEGTIAVDLRGKNMPGQSFVGIGFRGVDDNTGDQVYFRPFNFQNPERRNSFGAIRVGSQFALE